MPGQDVRPSAASVGSRFYYGYTVVAAASFAMVLIFGVHYAFGVFFKPLSTEFGWTRAMTSGAFSLVWIAQGALAVVMGGLNDRFGPRLVLTVCGGLIGAGYLLMSRIDALWQLYLFYGILVGAGLGGTFVPLTSTTARWFVAKRGLMTGIVTAGVGIGAFIGPPIANWLIAAYSWRTSYAVLGAVVLVGVVIASQFLRREPSEIGLSAYGESASTSRADSETTAGVPFRAAVKTVQFWLTIAVFFFYGFCLSAILLHLAPYATDVGLSAATAAQLLSTLGGASVVGKVLMGKVTDAIGSRRVYLVSFTIMIASLAWLNAATSAAGLYGFAAAFGFAYGGLAAAHAPLMAWLFGMRQHGLIFGAAFNGWTLGCAVGPIVAGYIFDVAHSYRYAFVTCTACALVGLALTSLLVPVVNGRASRA